MRKSKVLKVIRDGGVALSLKLNFKDERAAEIAAMSGADCIWIDMEHTPTDYAFLENAIRAAKIYDCDVLTRVKRGSYSDLINPLEADSAGIMVPHLMDLKQAKEIVYYTKFYPIGRRPLDGGNADCAYGNNDIFDYLDTANKERFVTVQIEDPEPLPFLEEIASLDGIDMLFFGPADFSQGVGTPCKFDNPKIDKTRITVAECARRHGKAAGTVGSSQNVGRLTDLGYNFINIGADVTGLSKYFGDNVTACREQVKSLR